MLSNLKRLDTAFQHVKIWTLILVGVSLSIMFLTLLFSFLALRDARQEVYVISQDQAIKAFASSREASISIEAKSHIRRFHELLFILSPDEKLISNQWEEALELGDESIKFHLDNLKETGYIKQLIGANVSQRIVIDSIALDESNAGYPFRFYGRQEIVRSSRIQFRNLVTAGKLRLIQRTAANPHGLLIENWEILDNRDLFQKSR